MSPTRGTFSSFCLWPAPRHSLWAPRCQGPWGTPVPPTQSGTWGCLRATAQMDGWKVGFDCVEPPHKELTSSPLCWTRSLYSYWPWMRKCLTRVRLCDPMDYIVHGILQAGILKCFPSPGNLPNPGIKPRFPTLQADSLPAEPQGKPKNNGVGSLSLL